MKTLTWVWLAPGCLALLVPDTSQTFHDVHAHAKWLKTWFGVERAGIAIELLHRAGDDALRTLVKRIAQLTGLPIVAAGDVLMHVRSRNGCRSIVSMPCCWM